MTVLTRQPTSPNFLSPFGFQFNILKAPAVNFFVQTAELPGISIGEIEVPNPFAKIKEPGTQLSFTDFNVTFKCDEKLQGYFEIYNWMRKLGFPDTFDEYAELSTDAASTDGVFSDISLIILSNEKNPIYTATFKDAFPLTLGPLRFDTTQQSLDYLVVDTTFAYRSYSISAA
jgi:hypothetical protein